MLAEVLIEANQFTSKGLKIYKANLRSCKISIARSSNWIPCVKVKIGQGYVCAVALPLDPGPTAT